MPAQMRRHHRSKPVGMRRPPYNSRANPPALLGVRRAERSPPRRRRHPDQFLAPPRRRFTPHPEPQAPPMRHRLVSRQPQRALRQSVPAAWRHKVRPEPRIPREGIPSLPMLERPRPEHRRMNKRHPPERQSTTPPRPPHRVIPTAHRPVLLRAPLAPTHTVSSRRSIQTHPLPRRRVLTHPVTTRRLALRRLKAPHPQMASSPA
jgi:hypothetical protein